ncbi:MAG: GIY-YIG nuclease family protein [Gemmatimonadaceae bacterium]
MATGTSSTVILKGRSGATYGFTVYPIDTKFKAVGAVYTILQSSSDGIIYIGQTGDLSERFDDHHKATCFARHGASFIGVHGETSERNRLAIETDLVQHYGPPCNG